MKRPRKLPELEEYRERYAGVGHERLCVTAHLMAGGRIVHYDAPTLDGVLAYAVVAKALEGRTIGHVEDGLDVPLPLAKLWTEPFSELPLWAATPFVSVGAAVQDLVVETKRPQRGFWTRGRGGRFNIGPATGRFRERMTPRPVMVSDTWVAQCIGNAEEIERLLAYVPALGKRRGTGHGEIARWSVEQAAEFALAPDGVLALAMPKDAFRARFGETPSVAESLVAWTPPYWHRGFWRDGWPAGTPLWPKGSSGDV